MRAQPRDVFQIMMFIAIHGDVHSRYCSASNPPGDFKYVHEGRAFSRGLSILGHSLCMQALHPQPHEPNPELPKGVRKMLRGIHGIQPNLLAPHKEGGFVGALMMTRGRFLNSHVIPKATRARGPRMPSSTKPTAWITATSIWKAN